MDGGLLGGGVLFAVLSLLWIAVLAPNWVKNREFRAAEQNAARIQRTLRILAETAEVPEEHVVEATAKEAVAHEKMLKAARGYEAATYKREAAQLRTQHQRTEYEQSRMLADQKKALRAARLSHPKLKPVRILAALAVAVGVAGLLVGLGMVFGGFGSGVLIGSTALAVIGTGTLVGLAPGARPKIVAPNSVRVSPQQTPLLDQEAPVKKQMDTSQADYESHQARVAEQRERARTMAKARQLAATSTPKVNQTDSILLREAVPKQRDMHPQLDVQEKSRRLVAQERLSSMGVVGDTSEGATSLEEALKRRRDAS